MSRALLVAVALVSTTVVVPAGATEPDACAPPAEGVTVVTPDDFSGTIAAPLMPEDRTQRTFQLDLSPAKLVNRATTSVTLEWTVAANDFNLWLLNEDGRQLASSEGFQPVDPAVEQATLAKLAHCSEFVVEIENHTAVGVPEQVVPLRLSIDVGAVQ